MNLLPASKSLSLTVTWPDDRGRVYIGRSGIRRRRSRYPVKGFVGCSSHSGRRTFITNAARKISTVGGSLRDVQVLAGHTNLRTTQRYIDENPEAHAKIVELV